MYNHNFIYNEEYYNKTFVNKCICWGKNDNGQLGLGLESRLSTNKTIHNNKNISTRIKKIAVGGMHTLIYDEYDNLYGFGNNVFGQLSFNEPTKQIYDIPKMIFRGKKVKDIVCGGNYTIVYKENGDVLVTGCNTNGELGLGDKTTRKGFTLLTNDVNIKYIRAGLNFTIMYRNNGDLIGFGNNTNGQLGLSAKLKFLLKPKKILNDKTIVEIECGQFHTIIRKQDGSVYGSGMNIMGQLGAGAIKNLYEFTNLFNDKYIRKIACGGCHTMILDKFGNLFGCGNNGSGQMGRPEKICHKQIVLILQNINIRDIITGMMHTILYENNGNIITFGNNINGQLGYNTNEASTNKMHELLKTTNIKIINNKIIGDIYWIPESFKSLDKFNKMEIKTFLFVHNIFNQKFKQFTYPLRYTKHVIISNILKQK